jgi:hypothetical protein
MSPTMKRGLVAMVDGTGAQSWRDAGAHLAYGVGTPVIFKLLAGER